MLARGSTRRRHRWGVGSKVGSQEMCVTVRFARNSRGRPHVVLGPARRPVRVTGHASALIRSVYNLHAVHHLKRITYLKRRLEGGPHAARARAAMRRGDRGGGASRSFRLFRH
jgi:hypothetical protein